MQIEHQPERSRFVSDTSAGQAQLSYKKPSPEVLDLRHTFVPIGARNHGVGAGLAEYAFTFARENDLKVIPTCSFVQAWIGKHPEFGDVLQSRS